MEKSTCIQTLGNILNTMVTGTYVASETTKEFICYITSCTPEGTVQILTIFFFIETKGLVKE